MAPCSPLTLFPSIDYKFVSMDLRHLVRKCQSGDKEAFGILYQTYRIPMQQIVSYYVHNSEAVWDILHDGFLIAYVSINSLKNTSKVEAWLTSIMKNLSLQYLKNESNHISVPLSEESVADYYDNESHPLPELTWEELDSIINRLPQGYGKVFRLAVLDGMSHKEIGAMLGIAPHSSSSQLAHAKAMMRRMIIKYKVEIGAMSIAAIILLVWNGLFRSRNEVLSNQEISKNSDKEIQIFTDTVTDTETDPDSGTNIKQIIQKTSYPKLKSQENIATITESKDSVSIHVNDTPANDTIRIRPGIIDNGEFIATEDFSPLGSDNPHDWALSLAYSGTLEQNNYDKYRIPNPEIPDVEGPVGEIDVTEKTRHYMPLVIGLSVNKSLSSRWSIETGLRYTFLRSDIHSESELMNKETIQRIHYIGIPLKFNYCILTYKGFSLYGQGGGALDIPVYGTQSISEYSPKFGATNKDALHINAPLQWSVEGGLGIQYHFTPSLSIYAEPSLRYYFNPASDIRTIRQEKPVEFTIPIGLRLTM